MKALILLFSLVGCSTSYEWKSKCASTDILDITKRPWSLVDTEMLKIGKTGCIQRGAKNGRTCLKEMHRKPKNHFYFECGFKRSTYESQ